jgi:hypothetical protein
MKILIAFGLGGVLWRLWSWPSPRLPFGPSLIFLQGRLGNDVIGSATLLRETPGLEPSLSDGLANHVRRDAKSLGSLLNGKNSFHVRYSITNVIVTDK